jgi:serine/threonine protein kinase/tetratricopeptide (TPR) repeat protein
MEAERWKQVDELLQSALQVPSEQRDEFLRQACAGDAGLEQEVRSLLASDQSAGGFLQGPAIKDAAQMIALNKAREIVDVVLGQTISHYRVLKQLGSGGMGVVYEAEDIRLGRHVALKLLLESEATNSKALQRFEQEARAISSLNHPNICTLYEVEEYQAKPVIVMELLEGQTLKERMRAGRVPLKQLLEWGIDIADALDAAHATGLVHRDIKPANLFMTSRGRAKVLDFGLAKLTTTLPGTARLEDDSLTSLGVIPGTTPYMSPEQVRGDDLDGRTDIFSLGTVLYEMATGERPFAEKNPVLTMDSVLNKRPVPLTQVNPELPPELERIVEKALEKQLDLRYSSAADVRTDLSQLKHDTDRGTASPGHTASSIFYQTLVAPGTKLWKILAAILVVTGLTALGLYYRSHRANGLTNKDTIVLSDFTNTTGDAVFDDTLKTALNVSLRQSPFLNVLPDSEVTKALQLMTRPAGTELTPELAREVCQRADSKVYVAGSIGSLGNEYVLALKAANCQNGDTIAQEQVTAPSKEKVLDGVGEAASKLRAELGESLATVQKFDIPLDRATTASLEALKAYSLGWKAMLDKGTAAALPLHQRAVELDPNFAMGYRALGRDYESLGEPGRASEYYAKAFRLRGRASEREKQAIAADYYDFVTGELDKAVQIYQQEIESYPRESITYTRLGTVFAFLGQYEKAVEITKQAVPLDKDSSLHLSNLAKYALALQNFEEARKITHNLQAQKRDDDILHLFLYALAFLGSDSSAMSEQQRWFVSRTEYENFGLAYASDTEAYGGHLAKARELTRRAVNSAVRADNKESAAIYLANAALEQAAYGNAAEARRSAGEALKLVPESPGAAAEAALAFSMVGDAARAQSLAQELRKRFPLNTQMQSLWLPSIQAQSALDRKSPNSALNALQPASPLELGETPFGNNISCLYPVYVRAQAYLAAGQGNAAAAEFQKILDHSGIVWNCWTGALARLGVARANALQSRTSRGADADAARVRALAAYNDFLALWKDADPDVAVLKQAKSEYAKLQ